jgi:hypothetical protein
MTYLRTTIGRWSLDLDSEEAERILARIRQEGVEVFRSQPGFIRYRLMIADSHTTIAVAEWQTEELGLAGAGRFREWLHTRGISRNLSLETYAGEIVISS